MSAASIRRIALCDAAKDICCYCARRAFPDEAAPLAGPNAAGNYVHVPPSRDPCLCVASAIWARMRHEYGLDGVKSMSPRGWEEVLGG